MEKEITRHKTLPACVGGIYTMHGQTEDFQIYQDECERVSDRNFTYDPRTRKIIHFEDVKVKNEYL